MSPANLDVAAGTLIDLEQLVDVDKPLVCIASRECPRTPMWWGTPPCGHAGAMCDNHKIDRQHAAMRGAAMRCPACRAVHDAPVHITWTEL